MAWLHRPQGPHDDPVVFQKNLYTELQHLLANGEKLLVHQEEVGDRVWGSWPATCCGPGLVPFGPQAISVTERLTGRQLGPLGRGLVAIADELRPTTTGTDLAPRAERATMTTTAATGSSCAGCGSWRRRRARPRAPARTSPSSSTST